MKEVTILISNEELNALEDLCFNELPAEQEACAREAAANVWSRLLIQYESAPELIYDTAVNYYEDHALYTLEVFQELVGKGILRGEDGYGYYAKDRVYCSAYEVFSHPPLEGATHVIWFIK